MSNQGQRPPVQGQNRVSESQRNNFANNFQAQERQYRQAQPAPNATSQQVPKEAPGAAQRINNISVASEPEVVAPEYHLELKVYGKPIKGTIDTGAYKTAMDYSYFQQNFMNHVEMKRPEALKTIGGVGGTIKPIEGVADLVYTYVDKRGGEQSVQHLDY